MKAFWTVRPAVQDAEGGWGPLFPVGFKARWQNNGDIRILPAGAAPADHKHAISGCYALGSNHGHYVVYWQTESDEVTVKQDFFGGGTPHDHVDNSLPDHFMVFIVCTSAMYDQLLIDVPSILILGENEIIADEEGTGAIGGVDNTTWTAGERTDWENIFANFGLELPEKVQSDRWLVQFCLVLFHAPKQRLLNERNYRYGGVEIIDSIPPYEE